MTRFPTRFRLLAVLLAAAGATSAFAQAADTPSAEPLTRAQVRMERAEFVKSHRWDEATGNWVLKPGFDAPMGMKTRAQVMAERDEILRNNQWDESTGTWVPLKGKPREMSTLSREQVRKETAEFVRTHRWDEETETWMIKSAAMSKR
jgi:hypothetical protein